MRLLQRVADLRRYGDCIVYLFKGNRVGKRSAFDVLHGHKQFAVKFFDTEDGTDIRMIQSCGSLCLLKEPRLGRFVVVHPVGKEFECDDPIEFGVFRFVHNPHSSLSQLLNDFVLQYRLSNHGADLLLLIIL